MLTPLVFVAQFIVNKCLKFSSRSYGRQGRLLRLIWQWYVIAVTLKQLQQELLCSVVAAVVPYHAPTQVQFAVLTYMKPT